MTDPAAASPSTDPHHQQPPRKRASTAASLTQSIASFTEDLVLNRDPAPGFFAATAQATSRAPTLGEIRKGSFGEEGWAAQQHGARGSGSSWDKKRSWSGSGSRGGLGKRQGSRDSVKEGHGQVHGAAVVEPFAPLTEEPTSIGEDDGIATTRRKNEGVEHVDVQSVRESSLLERPQESQRRAARRADESLPEKDEPFDDKTLQPQPLGAQRAHTSGYIPPPKLPWTQSTAIALKAFGKWFITPFGFLVTIYGLNVVAWGGMLFLLLCGAAPAMCYPPIPTPENRQKMSPAAALNLPGPYYQNCDDINAPKRIWIEIDSQILNALFCVTGFGLVPWRFRDLYYLLRYRFASTKKQGLEGKMYGLRVLAGIHKGWFRLPGSETMDTSTSREYLHRLEKDAPSPMTPPTSDLESNASSTPHHDLRLPIPLAKRPSDPITSVRAPPTKIWLMDFFIWCQCWNTFFQCCLCGFMWGQDRYDRPPWSTGLFVALACIIAGVGGVVSFVEGRKVKRVEGVAPSGVEGAQVVDGGDALRLTWDGAYEGKNASAKDGMGTDK